LSSILERKNELSQKSKEIFFRTFCLRPLPTATTVALRTLPNAFSGICIPPLVFVSGAKRSTSTRSNKGIIRFNAEDAYEDQNQNQNFYSFDCIYHLR
jgi:hypothetical protein